jgi:Lamin Tail Domain/Bacterial Ig domain/Secretion system C-terminal sorting domain
LRRIFAFRKTGLHQHIIHTYHFFMKKITLALAVFFLALSAIKSQVVITEIMYNPPNPGTDTLEYIELYNNSNATVDLSGWTFSKGVTLTFAQGTSLPAKGYIVACFNPAYLEARFQGVATAAYTGGLSNGGEAIELKDASGNIIDDVTYGNAAPWAVEANGQGASLVLCDPNADNSQAVNWRAATTATNVTIAGIQIKANPGADAGCTGANELTANNDNFTLVSGTSRTINVLSNDLTPNPLTSIIILVPPTQGSATVNADKTILYQGKAGYCGPDQFQYKICDAQKCDTATVTMFNRCFPTRTIAQMTNENVTTGVADSLNRDCELTGVVYGVNMRPTNGTPPAPSLLFTLIDNNGDGIQVSRLAGTLGYSVTEKDRITVRGRIGQFNGLTEIQPDTIIKVSANNTLVNPTVVTKLGENTESKLVRINKVRLVNPSEWTTGMGASGFNVRVVSDDNLADTLVLRIDRDIETYNAPVPGEPFTLRGIGGQFDASNPFTSGYQILPRYNADISTLVNVRIVDFSKNVQISPNPGKDKIWLKSDLNFDRVSIVWANGQVVKSFEKPAQNFEISLTDMISGMYFIRFEKDGTAWSTKFIKQ